ncbi:MAG TPA: hypothetical protein VFZ65_03150, partial [Planctomycetota bacterium]|nr:hypothetical protein [Planctomycetota bacterium]
AVGLALVVAAVAGPILWRQHAAAIQRQKADLYATLPSLLAVEGWPDERILRELEPENHSGIDLLDKILALDPGDLPARLYRAFLRLDLGEHAGAAADLEVLAQAGGSAYLHALAQRYAAADPSQRGTMAVDVSDLPEPSGPEECYVAGCHELRNRHLQGFAARADALFARAGSYMPARDQRLLTYAALAERAGEDQKRVLSRKLYDETIALEAEYHRKTARTCAMRGVALMLMARYREAVDDLLQSLELRPDRHSPHQNLGVAYLRLGDLDASEHHLREALRCRPLWNTKFMLAQLMRDRGNYAAAYELAARLPTADPRIEPWMVPDLVGSIAIDEAMSLLASDRERSRQAAGRAIASYDIALAVHPTAKGRQRRAMAEALQADDPHAAMVPFAEVLLAEPDNAYHLATLAYLLPRGGLDARQTAWLGALLRRLAARRAPGDEVLRARLEAEIEQGLAPYRKEPDRDK